MLPAKGYLKSINCPFFETCICERPYCHYKHSTINRHHNKKDTTDLISEIVSKAVHKVLQENGSTNINNNNNNNNVNNVTYNPTPISQLNKYKNEQNNSSSNIQSSTSIKKKHIPIQYTPEQPRAFRNIQQKPIVINYVPKLTTHIPQQQQQQKQLQQEQEPPVIVVDDEIEDISDDESTLDQCKRIFEEYKPPITTTTNNPLKRSNNNEHPTKSKRIASVPNVSAILDAKKSIDLLMKKSNKPTTTLTSSSSTNPKVRRIAHAPQLNSFADLPIVLEANKSKLPVNIRSRFFFLIVKECVKLYISKKAAYERALNEEFNCYTKCTVITTYKNAIMLLINRLRKEINGSGQSSNTDYHHASSILFDGQMLYKHFHKWILTQEELFDNGFPRLGALRKGHALFKVNRVIEKVPDNCQQCARCKKMFQVNERGYPAFPEDCIYHPYNRVLIKGEAKYSCCQQISLRSGCCISSTHVFEIKTADKLTGFVSTFAPESNKDPRSSKIFALDCEMVYTTRGLELARVTVIDDKCNVCYESLVKPLGAILDCNTRFSGLTIDTLQNVTTTIRDVQAALLLMFNSETILVGHSFESDLKALRLIHNCVVDTSVLFPHKMGPPKKRALRTLASEFLKKIIQNNDEGGHDSAEDAVTCMELLIWKLKEELKTR